MGINWFDYFSFYVPAHQRVWVMLKKKPNGFNIFLSLLYIVSNSVKLL